jgi:hypothetical protein
VSKQEGEGGRERERHEREIGMRERDGGRHGVKERKREREGGRDR